MTTNSPVIAVIGSGAVGVYYGGRLAQHGHSVHFLMRGDYAAVQQHGWRVKSCDGDFDLPPEKINVYDDVRKMPKADLVLVALKATANNAVGDLVRPVLADHGV